MANLPGTEGKANQPIEMPRLPEKDQEAFHIVSDHMEKFMASLSKTARSADQMKYVDDLEPIIRAALSFAQEPPTQHSLDSFLVVLDNEKKKGSVSGWQDLTVRKGLPAAKPDVNQLTRDLNNDANSIINS